MPIKVSCQCGKRLSVKDEYAGKRVKCPGCGRTLSIPQPQAAGGGEGMSDLLDDVGVRAGVNRCPGCGVEIPEEAVLCVMCGFDLRRGHRIKTRVGSAMELEDDEFGDLPVHGVPLLDEAERRIAEDKLQQQNLSKGTPWWMLLLAFLGVVGFTAGMLMMPQEQVMRNGGIILMAAGGLLAFFFSIRLLIEAFKDSVLNGLLCLIVPPYVFYFVTSRWDRVAGIFMFMILGTLLCGLGALMVAFLAPLFEGKEEQAVGLRAWQERPNAVSVIDAPAEIGIRQRASTNRYTPPARKQCPRADARGAKAGASYRVASNEHLWPGDRTRAATTAEQKQRKHG